MVKTTISRQDRENLIVDEQQRPAAVGIGGGVGPMAGCMLHQLIIENTLSRGDQDHLDVFHVSRSSAVNDRTAFLEGTICDNPGRDMGDVSHSIAAAVKASKNQRFVVGVPCNTFHSPSIWEEFEKSVNGIEGATALHMLEETANHIREILPNATKLGLMSTTGTRLTRVYQDILTPLGFEVVQVPEEMQPDLHEAIYNPDWGIKACSPVSAEARNRFVSYVKVLAHAGCDAIILGCTEIPLALPEAQLYGVPLVNPMVALARALVKASDVSKLKPLPTLKAPSSPAAINKVDSPVAAFRGRKGRKRSRQASADDYL